MNEQLKPCPFCGGEAQFIRTESGIVKISCSICGAATLFTSDAIFIIQKWNKRKRKSLFIRECPFCGKKAKLHEAYDRTFVIQCTNCHNSSNHYRMEQEAINAWNKRFEEDNDE